MSLTKAEKAAAKAAKEAEKAAAKATADAATPDAPEAEDVTGTATVTFNGNTRTYSREIHGRNYKALAQMLADQYPGSTVE